MRFVSGRFFLGLIITVVGVLLLLNNLVEGIDVDVRLIIRFWPVIPLVFGLNWVISSFGSTSAAGEQRVFFSWGQFVTGLLAIAVGVIFLGRNLDLFYVDISIFWNLLWPIILILIGFSFLRGRAFSSASGGRFAFMGGAKVGGSEPWKLESGSYFAFMGGIEMDLRSAEIEEGETVIDLTAIMGGIDVKIPRGMAVVYDGNAFLGGVAFMDYDDGGLIGGRKIESNIQEDSSKIVRIQARAIMGGVEIKEA